MSFDLAEEKPYPSEGVLKDVKKLRHADFPGERFVLAFLTHHRQTPRREYEDHGLIKYADGMRKHGVIEPGVVRDGLERFRQATGGLPAVAQDEVPAGRAFGIDVSVFYLLLAVSA